jgi:hypothetical protein
VPTIKITKTAIDALPVHAKDTVYWDAGLPGFGVKVTPKGKKVFIVLYRTGGAGSRLTLSRLVSPAIVDGSSHQRPSCSWKPKEE